MTFEEFLNRCCIKGELVYKTKSREVKRQAMVLFSEGDLMDIAENAANPEAAVAVAEDVLGLDNHYFNQEQLVDLNDLDEESAEEIISELEGAIHYNHEAAEGENCYAILDDFAISDLSSGTVTFEDDVLGLDWSESSLIGTQDHTQEVFEKIINA